MTRLVLTMLLAAAVLGCARTEHAAVEVQSAVEAQATPTLSTDDATFLNEAAKSGITEVTFGQLARAQGKSAAARDFGLRMTTEHTRINQDVTRLAAAKNLSPDNTVDAANQAAYDRIAALRGRDFDRAYLDHEVADHQAAMALYAAEVAHGRDPDVRALAARLAPTIRAHLDLAMRLGGRPPMPAT